MNKKEGDSYSTLHHTKESRAVATIRARVVVLYRGRHRLHSESSHFCFGSSSRGVI